MRKSASSVSSRFIRPRPNHHNAQGPAIVKGFVPTPSAVVDLMTSKLFGSRTVSADTSVLDPGCGNGEFIAGILRWCKTSGSPIPRIVGIELDPERAATASARFSAVESVTIQCGDFLSSHEGSFDFVIGNPPYVSIGGLSIEERVRYRSAFVTAQGRFDLYSLFFEQALRLLRPDGRLVFITPEKYTYVETARPLRELLATRGVEELHYCQEDLFDGYVTYPLITTASGLRSQSRARIVRRDGVRTITALPSSSSWMAAISGFIGTSAAGSPTLRDFALRISCGVATGADGVFVIPHDQLTSALSHFAFPTVSGRQIQHKHDIELPPSYLLAPYDADGSLLPESRLGGLGVFLRTSNRRRQLEGRTCVVRKPWYAFHDNFPLGDMLRPKLLFKDIGAEPVFVTDRLGEIVPRHSVYYVVPRNPEDLPPLARYLGSDDARAWLRAHCQRAANGFLRVQSHVLKQLPIPPSVEVELSGRQQVSAHAALLPA